MAPRLNRLASLLRSNSPDHNAKGTQSVVTGTSPCPTSYRLYACRFRIYFTPRTGVLFTFPSRYSFTIGHQRIFRLNGWSRQIHTEFHEFGITWDDNYKKIAFRLQGYNLLCRTFPRPSSTPSFSDLSDTRQSVNVGPTTPDMQRLPAWHISGLA